MPPAKGEEVYCLQCGKSPVHQGNVGRISQLILHSLLVTLETHTECRLMLQCDKCDAWRLLYSQNKLSHERRDLDAAIAAYSFTCGAPLQDLNLPGKLAHVYIRNTSCGVPIEKLYYTVKYPPICLLPSVQELL